MDENFFLFDLIQSYIFCEIFLILRIPISIIYFDKFYNSIIYFEVLSNRQTEYLLDILNGFLELAEEQE